MATLTTLPPVQPVNRLRGLLPPQGQQVSRPAPPQPAKRFQARPEEYGPEAVLAALVMVPLALVAVVLWPVVLVALVLGLVALTPFVAGVAGLRAILPHGRRAAG
jgi:hypothetical protein